MNNHDYEKAAASTALYREAGQGTILALAYVALGLTNEAGEVAGKVKKLIRRDYDLDQEKRAAIAAELGDVLWYLTRCANELGITLDEIQAANVAKLSDRNERGVIKGEGDQR